MDRIGLLVWTSKIATLDWARGPLGLVGNAWVPVYMNHHVVNLGVRKATHTHTHSVVLTTAASRPTMQTSSNQ